MTKPETPTPAASGAAPALPTDAMIHAAAHAFDVSNATFLVKMRCALSAALARQEAAPAKDGYATAFYEIASVLGIGARADTPENVFRNEMLPRIVALASREASPDVMFPNVDGKCNCALYPPGTLDPCPDHPNALASPSAQLHRAAPGLTIESLKEKIAEAIRLADVVGRSRGSNSYATNRSALETMVDLQIEIDEAIDALASPQVAPEGGEDREALRQALGEVLSSTLVGMCEDDVAPDWCDSRHIDEVLDELMPVICIHVDSQMADPARATPVKVAPPPSEPVPFGKVLTMLRWARKHYLDDVRLFGNEHDTRRRRETMQERADRISTVMQENEDLRNFCAEVDALLAEVDAAPVAPQPIGYAVERSAFRVSPHGQDAESREWMEFTDDPKEKGAFPVWAAPVAPQDDARDAAQPEYFDAYLCRAWGETDLPAVELVLDEAGIRAFMVREWLGSEDKTANDGTPLLPEAMEEIAQHNWQDDPVWSIDFEIGGVSVERVTGFAPAAKPTEEPQA